MQLDRCRRLLLIAAIGLTVSPSAGQVMRLPPVTPSEPPSADRLASYSYPGSAARILQAPGEPALPEQPERPPDARPGMFQKLILTGEWLAGGRYDDFGVSSVELKTILALPIPSRTYPMIITPGFAVHYLDGPVSVDLPPRTYDAYVQFRWMRRLTPRLGMDLAITPGAFGDFQQSNDETFRITGHAVTAWEWSPVSKIVLGAASIDRYSTDVLPVAGLIWTPYDDVKYELVFPHPRIARRIYGFGACTEEVQDWIYLAGELGGGIWAIERIDGTDDVVDYTDYRVFAGVERKVIGGLDARVELGYVFGRKLRFASPTPQIEPDGTVMVRGALVY